MTAYADGYRDGFAAAVMAMTDLVLAGGEWFVDAQAMCLDFHRERLLPWERGDAPEMERPRLAVLDLPFSDPPLTDEEADALLAGEMGEGDLADLEGSDA